MTVETSLILYAVCFAVLASLAAALFWLVERGSQARGQRTSAYSHFQRWFLLGWGICVAADWLQGPYLYVLYSAYGFEKEVIAHLFLAGFVVSGVAGAFVGRLADHYGRRLACMVYCGLYIAACVTKHFNSYGVLMIGRILGGLATSLLFSVFESWVVSEMLGTHKVGAEEIHHLLGRMYLVSYTAAIATGLLSQGLVELAALREVEWAAGLYVGGSCLPYDASTLSLLLGMVIIYSKWAENYGERHEHVGLRSLPKDWVAWTVGLVAACFESAMYIFVFSFTPALKGAPMGFVFSLFMLASMCGASALGLFVRHGIEPATLLPPLLLAGAASLAAAAVFDFPFLLTIGACLIFEASAGIYWPAMATLKGQVVAEEVRAHVYNLYRIPLNAMVVAALLKGPGPKVCFIISASLLATGTVLSSFVCVARKRRRAPEVARTCLVESADAS